MYHFLPWMTFLCQVLLFLLLTGCQRWRWGATCAQRGERDVWGGGGGGGGGEGESRQGCAKMELMVKIEMTAWTWWLMTDTAEKTHTHTQRGIQKFEEKHAGLAEGWIPPTVSNSILQTAKKHTAAFRALVWKYAHFQTHSLMTLISFFGVL